MVLIAVVVLAKGWLVIVLAFEVLFNDSLELFKVDNFG